MPGPPVVNDAFVARSLGDTAADRGLDYYLDGRVLDVTWNERANHLTGLVAGTRDAPYRVGVVFAPRSRSGSRAELLASTCTCPVRADCKHVAAVLYALANDETASATPPDTVPDAGTPLWRTRLNPLARPTQPVQSGRRSDLGLQLRVAATTPSRYGADATVGLHVRPVVMGDKGRWLASGVNWQNLTYSHQVGTATQRNLARQLSALHAVDSPHSGSETWLQLQRVRAPLMWDVLDQLVASGVPLVMDDKEQSPVGLLAEPVPVSIDVRRDDSGLTVSVPVLVDDERIDTDRLGFVGSPAHGMFTWDVNPLTGKPADLRLGRLAQPVDDALVGLAMQPPVHVPATDADRFVAELMPAIAAAHPVTSSDGSFTPPAPPQPLLDLQLRHFGQGRAELAWGWRYVRPGDDPATAPLVGLTPGRSDSSQVRRDREAEAAILAGLGWLVADFPHLGSPTADGHRLSSIGMLSGLPMLAFVRDALPRLQADEHIVVSVTGSALDYREADEAPTITIATTERASHRDWLDLDVTVSVDGQNVPFDLLFRALVAEQDVLILDSGTYLRLDQPALQRLRALIEEARAMQEHVRDRLGVNRYHVDLWAELEQLGVVDEQTAEWRRSLALLAADAAIPPRPTPPGIDATLRHYQADGFAWLAYLREHGLGGILADDMGLGKTLQAIALIADERQQSSAAEQTTSNDTSAPWLVVAPASVVHNWVAEIARFAPALRVVAIEETSAKRGSTVGDVATGADVVVVSYTLFRLDIDEFDALEWTGLILDEAQFVKNHQSKAYQCARRLRAPFKLAVTGTPMENNLMELWSLLSITAPGLFPSPKRFAEFFQRPIERDGDDDRLALLRRRIRPFMLRRTKEDVATELPPKQEQVLELDLHPRHRKVYETRLQRERQKVLGLLADVDGNRFQIFQSLTMLRQLSLDARLVDETQTGIPSAKLDALMEMLDDVLAEGHRVLVFSQFTRYLALARERLDAAGIGYAYLDGSTRDRGAVIDTFRSGERPVFLISLKAGGFGLNLTEADYVVLLDPWWNPATEAQAVDRAHRIGQERQVMVYRLVARATIEEKVMALKEEKAALFASVMSDARAGAKGLSADDIRDLLA